MDEGTETRWVTEVRIFQSERKTTEERKLNNSKYEKKKHPTTYSNNRTSTTTKVAIYVSGWFIVVALIDGTKRHFDEVFFGCY